MHRPFSRQCRCRRGGGAGRRELHYLDVAAEQASAWATLEKYDVAAQKAGLAVVPAIGIYGGFADLLVTAALGDWNRADAIDIAIGMDSWHPTQGTRKTGERNTAHRCVVAAGSSRRSPRR